MQPDDIRREMTCPMNGHLCIDGIRDDFKKAADGRQKPCRFWTHIYGKDPQSEKIYDKYDCANPWLTVTTLEGSQNTRMVIASLDKVANQITEMGGGLRGAFTDMVNAFLQMAENNRKVLEHKRSEPSILEIPPNGGNNGE